MKRLTAFGAVLLLASTVFPLAAPARPAVADASDGTLTVRVVRDLNGNGSYEPALETGVAGIPVKATDPAGATAAGTTAADGTVKLATTGLAGGKYRVEASIPASMPYLKPAPAGGSLSSLTSFVDVSGGKKADLTMGVWNPADYCQDNPALVTACQRNGIAPGIAPGARSLVSFPFTARGTGTAPTPLATQGDTGTVYGIAYRKQDKRVFSSAFAKRATAYGPGGTGGIYVTDTAAKTTKLFTKVPGAGTTAHAMQTNFDGAFADVVGKESLGAMRISEDGSTLFVVNLLDRKLYLYDATAATATAPKASYPIPDPNCPAAGDWRPGGLGVHDGVVFVGGVCSGESTQKTADMRVVIRTFDAAAGTFGPVIVDHKLDFKRGDALWDGSNTHFWNPWQTTYQAPPAQAAHLITRPEPLLTDIRAESGGDLVLGFRDRFGDQGGHDMPPFAGSPDKYDTVSGGDLNRVCKQAGGYVWEGTSGCPNNNSAAADGGGEPTDVVEYYPGEYFADTEHGKPHNETAQGAVAVVYPAARMPATVMDPTAINTGGVGWFDRANGTMMNASFSNSYLINDSSTEGWAKANGLADLEALCDSAPVQLGNRVWFDTNANGIQDPDEPAVAGVKVLLLPCDGKGAALATKTTGANGEYYFGAADGLKAGTCYTVKFDYSGIDTSALPGAPPLSSIKWTVQKAGGDATIDSDPDPATGIAKVTMGPAGSVDHTVDAGLTAAANRLGDFVWADLNRNGLQDAGEPGVPDVPVVLKDGNGKQLATTKTDSAGKYLFDKLPDGSYQVCFDRSKLTGNYAGWLWTKPNAGDDGKDSDADPPTGCTPVVKLGVGNRENLTLDAGLVSPPNRLGDFVWADLNANGLQDAGEPGVPDVPVTLKDGTGKQVATTKTGPDGKYLFDDLPDGSYQVCFDRTKLPAAYADWQWTKPDAGDDGKDSDADPATGCTPVVKLGPGARENLTLDAGLVEPRNRLGDFVWKDLNANGLQDPGEPGVPDVPVILKDGNGKEVGTTKTGPDGKYLFDNLPSGSYQVCFDIAHLPAPVADYKLTKPDAGDDGKDSDADPATGCTPVVKLGPGSRENLTLDAGLVSPPNRLGDFVWADLNRNGLQDAGEPGVPDVPVVLKDGTGKQLAATSTGPDGKYSFDNLPDGSYQVCFDRSKLTGKYAGWQWTKPDAGDDGKDSDADLATGCTPVVTLGVGKRENLTLDAGLVEPRNRIGDFVWLDINGNGLQDPGEPGVPDVPVVLKDGTGKQVASTKTDSGGKYLFDDLPDGGYQVCFDTGGRKLTQPDVGTDDQRDSDAQLSDGCTPVLSVGPAKREDLGADAGLLPAPAPAPVTPPKKGPLASTGFPGFWLLGLGGLAVAAGIAALLAARRARRTE